MPFTIFPLHGIIRDAEGVARCACAQPDCGSKPGKHPAVAWSRLAAGEQVRGSAGHGIATGYRSGIFVIDLDSHAANEAFADMGECPDTYTVATARGWHLYFNWPGFAVHTGKNVFGPGIDVRGDGGMVVAPGSEHVDGGLYEVTEDIPIADAPAWLLERPELRGKIDQGTSDNAPTPVEPGTPIFGTRVELGKLACEEWDPHGGTTFFKLALRLVRDLELPLATCHELISQHFNPRAVDESGKPWHWTDKDIDHKLTQARDKSDIPAGNATDIDPEKLKAAAGIGSEDAWLAAIGANPQGAKTSVPFEVEYGGLEDADAPIDYLVDKILPVASVGMFVAQPYVMKTWAAYSLGIAVSQGKPWLGRHATKRGKVLIVDYEMGKRKVKKRLRMLGDDGTVGRIIKPGVRLDNIDFWKHLYDLGPSLVIIDSLSAGNRANDENSPQFVFPLDRASDMASASDCSFIVVHHAVKDTSGRSKQAWVRGTGAIFGQLDVCYALEAMPEGSKGEKRASLECIKMREGEEPPKFTLQLTDARGIELYEDAETKVLTGGNIEVAIRLALGRKSMSRNDLAAELHRRPPTVSDALETMKGRGEVVEFARQWHVDGPNIRAARIISTALDVNISQSVIATPNKLATVAHVKTEDVIELVAAGRLARTSEGSHGAWYVPA